MTETKREGDWVGDRFKLYTWSIRKALFYRPFEDGEWDATVPLIDSSVLDAWASYASLYTLFPNLTSTGWRSFSEIKLCSRGWMGIMNLTQVLLTRPVVCVDLQFRDELEPNSETGESDRSLLHVFKQITKNQSALHRLTVIMDFLPACVITRTLDTPLLRMHSLKSVNLCLGRQTSNYPPLSTEVLQHISTLPLLESVEFDPSPHFFVPSIDIPAKHFFPALRFLKLGSANCDISFYGMFIGAITSPCLLECHIHSDFFETFITEDMKGLVKLIQILALKTSLTLIDLGAFPAFNANVKIGYDDFRNLVTPLLPLARASKGIFRLYLRSMNFTICDELAAEAYPLFRFVLTYPIQPYIFRAQTLMELLENYPDIQESVVPLGIILDGDLEERWSSLEQMPQYTHLVVDADLSRGTDKSLVAYAHIVRYLFPCLRCLYAPSSSSSSADRNFWPMLAAELGNINCEDLEGPGGYSNWWKF
jgi:hypothetical protein